MDLNVELDRTRDLDVSEPANAVESIGFECMHCGACYKGYGGDDGPEPHTATVFLDKMYALQKADGDDSKDELRTPTEWRDVARPMPCGLVGGDDGPEDETFEWALQATTCGDCRFCEEGDSGRGTCQVHEGRPLVCETYPFSVAPGGMSQPMGEAVDEKGVVHAHECEDLGRDISRTDAEELARVLKERAVREPRGTQGVTGAYESIKAGSDEAVVHDSEGAKRPDGTRVQ